MTSTSTAEGSGAFVLSYQDVARVLSEVDFGTLVSRLAAEIEAVYQDDDVEGVDRSGWSRAPDALEIMGCQGTDFTCTKLISSIPGGNGSPTVTGTLVCAELGTDQARLVCDAAFLTPLRTATTSAVILKRVAPGARRLAVLGAGLEGIAHAVVLAYMSEAIETIRLLDTDPEQALQAAQEVRYLLKRDDLLGEREVEVEVCEDESRIYESEVLVTATYADALLLRKVKRLRDGAFVAAVGADLATKRELPPQLYDRAKFIADDLRQCLREGELQYAKNRLRGLEGEAKRIDDHRGELAGGRVVSATNFLAQPRPFLEREEPLTIYDSTGFSGQDLAVARVLLEVLEGREDIRRQPWNPAGTRSLVELLGCERPAEFVVRSPTGSAPGED